MGKKQAEAQSTYGETGALRDHKKAKGGNRARGGWALESQFTLCRGKVDPEGPSYHRSGENNSKGR